ncbi:hypothetical protein AUJ46_05215 [Candidatus Peregrinibacteria bacterium CG1_02_54_53]|nr:MAG: hypothetical protein AUJ46_05215 [Candidatus Peregrinibacteria bacterium CG1_02_54_53]
MFSLPSPFRLQRIYTITGILLFCLGIPVAVFAQKTPFVDVPDGAYYEDAAAALLESGALDRTTTLRPAALATRAELVKLMVNLNGTTLLYPNLSSFNDVSRSAWYFPYFEAAADAGWVRGNGNCYQQSRPCYASAASNVNRAEAASLLVRSFTLNSTGKAPVFSDNSQYQWYFTNIQSSADHCVLQGDDGTESVRPAAFMNRAEMVTMFYRASLNLQYGTDCSRQSAHITDVSAISPTRVRLVFDRDLSSARAEDAARYSISHSITVASASLIDSKTVELNLSNNLAAEVMYLVTASDLLAQDGTIFSDNANLSFTAPAAHITDITALTTRRIRLAFDIDLDTGRAADASRYTMTRASGVEAINVQTVTIFNNRTIEFLLATDITANITYRVTATHLLTRTGTDFTESATVVLAAAQTGHITTVTPVTANRISVSFDVDLDSLRAEDSSRYGLTDSTHALSIVSSQILTNRMVELSLNEAMQTQRSYALDVRGMQAASGVIFSDDTSFVYAAGTVNFHSNMTGGQEVPSVSTAASGTGSFLLMNDGLHYDITVRNMSGSIVSAHIHQGSAGQSGSEVLTITFNGKRAIGMWSNLTNEERSTLFDGGFYVNIQSSLHPDGEIRGQILR